MPLHATIGNHDVTFRAAFPHAPASEGGFAGGVLIERLFSKLKHFRRVATRYDKLAANFAMVQPASKRLWLRAK